MITTQEQATELPEAIYIRARGIASRAATRYRRPFDDLYQEAIVAALSHRSKWDPEHGATLETYLGRCMRRAVADYVRDKDTGVIKIPRDVIESAENVRIVVGEEELIESKETFSGGIAGADFLDWIENSKALDVDGGRIREFIRLRFVDGFTLKEIGDRWGMSFQTVSRIAVGYLETLEALGGLA